MNMQADALLEGSIDLHSHGYPEISPDCQMRVEDVEAIQMAAQAKMRGYLIKSHMWPTVGRVYQLKNQIKDFDIWPSMCLNTSAGGFDPWITEAGLKQGVKLIWMPTWSSRNDIKREGFSHIMRTWLPSIAKMKPEDGLTIFDDAGKVIPQVKEIFALAKDSDVAVSTGHLSPEEGIALARVAQDMGFKKLIFCHPDSKTVGANMDHIREMARLNCYIEFCFLGLLPAYYRISAQEVITRMREVGAQRCIMTTDYFFEWATPPSEMMRAFIGTLLAKGATVEEVDWMARKNPCMLMNATDKARMATTTA